MMSSRKIQATKDYRIFGRNPENRPVDVKKHKKLVKSMEAYGFLSCFPLVCCRDKDGKLTVKDGQHRLAIAESLKLTVHWVEEDVDFDIATINCTSRGWAPRDYAEKHALNGKQQYQEGLDFSKAHSLPIGIAFALLAGTTSFGNIDDQFYSGEFKIKDRSWADAVAGIYGPLTTMSASVKNSRFIEACMAVCRVDGFDGKRLLANAERCRERLVSFSTRDAYLDMLESIYNFGRTKLVALKIEAMKTMRDRNATFKARKEKEAKQQTAA